MLLRKRPKKKTKEEEERFRKELEENGGVEKKDIFAMIISAFLVILPVCILALAVPSLIVMALFGVFK